MASIGTTDRQLRTLYHSRNNRLRFFHIVLFWLASIAPFSSSLLAESKPDFPRKAMAILVGITDYTFQPGAQLKWCNNDVALIQNILNQYCTCSEFIVMTSNSEEPNKPTHDNILAQLDSRLRFANTEEYDRVFIFFAGHGERDPQTKKLYLLPQDFQINQYENTGICIDDLSHKMNAFTKIKEKILILDTCHAGAVLVNAARGGEIAEKMDETERLFTFASCKSNEQSRESPKCAHGIFTYWLCEGLSGKADGQLDNPRDDQVDTRELTNYVSQKVTKDTNQLQHPVGLSTGNNQWIPVLAFLPQQNGNAKPDYFLEEAIKYLKGNQYAAAIDRIGCALALDPNYPYSYAYRGLAHLERGKARKGTITEELAFIDWESGIADYNKAIDLANQNCEHPETSELANWHSKRSELRFHLKQYQEALTDANKVIELLPKSPQAYQNRAEILGKLHRFQEAEEDELKAHQLSDSSNENP